ncbi:chorismate-binding protein [Pseudomonas aeruginosa]
MRLFAGAGIVAASTPQAEWMETAAKLGTMLNAFGLNSGAL